MDELPASDRATWRILGELAAERVRQDFQHGKQSELPVVREDVSYGLSERAERAAYERYRADGRLSHMTIIMEELAEAIHAPTEADLRMELVQCAACFVKAIEALDYQRSIK